MDPSQVGLLSARQVGLLAEVTEIKRIYGAIASRLARFSHCCCAVTSSSVGEGKTTLAALLAVSSASFGRKKVLTVDFNWYRPALHTALGAEAGLDVKRLLQPGGVESQVRSTRFANIDFIGAPDPKEGVPVAGAEEMGGALAIINEARQRYDFIVIDTSSIYPVNRNMLDPVVAASAADGVVLVVLAGVTARQRAKRTLIGLETAGANVLGAVTNQWQNPLAQENWE